MDAVLIGNILTAVIPVIVPVVVAALKGLIPKIPKSLIPLAAIVAGAGIDLANVYATGQGLGGGWGVALGAAGIGVREVCRQFWKALNDEPDGRPPTRFSDIRPMIVLAITVSMLVGCTTLGLPKNVECAGKGTITVTGGMGGAITADCGTGFTYRSQ